MFINLYKNNAIMNVPIILLEFLIVIIAIIIRAFPAYKNKVGIDTWVHLLIAEEIKNNKYCTPKYIDYFIFKGPNDYPPFMHYLMAIFSKKTLQKIIWFISPLVEGINTLLMFVVALILTKDYSIALLSSLLYVFVPVIVFESDNLNTRPLGSLFFNISLFSNIYYVQNNNLSFLILAIFFGIILHLTHKMATQTFWATTLLFSIIYLNPLYLMVLISSFLGTLIISKGHYLEILRGHISIISFWNRHMSEYFTRDDYKEKISPSIKPVSKAIIRILGLTNNPWVFFRFVAFLFSEEIIVSDPLFVWTILIYSYFILTSYISIFKCFGDGYRYFEYGIMPTVILSANTIILGTVPLILLGIALFAFSILNSFRGLRNKGKRDIRFGQNSTLEKIFEIIKTSEKENIMCIPPNISFMASYFTKKKTLMALSPQAYEEAAVFMLGSPSKKNIGKLVNKYNINYIILDKTLYPKDTLDFNSIEYKMLVDENGYQLLEVTK